MNDRDINGDKRPKFLKSILDKSEKSSMRETEQKMREAAAKLSRISVVEELDASLIFTSFLYLVNEGQMMYCTTKASKWLNEYENSGYWIGVSRNKSFLAGKGEKKYSNSDIANISKKNQGMSIIKKVALSRFQGGSEYIAYMTDEEWNTLMDKGTDVALGKSSEKSVEDMIEDTVFAQNDNSIFMLLGAMDPDYDFSERRW